jgi:hypothetical protein
LRIGSSIGRASFPIVSPVLESRHQLATRILVKARLDALAAFITDQNRKPVVNGGPTTSIAYC